MQGEKRKVQIEFEAHLVDIVLDDVRIRGSGQKVQVGLVVAV